MTPSQALPAASRLVEVWRTFPAGTAVIVRRDNGSTFTATTRCRAYLTTGHDPIAVIDIEAPPAERGQWALSRVSLDAPPVTRLPIPIEPTPVARPLVDHIGSVAILAALALCLWGGAVGIVAWVVAP